MYNVFMGISIKNIRKKIFLLSVVCLLCISLCRAETITVISADSDTVCPYSYIFNNTTSLIVQDTIKSFNQTGSHYARSLSVSSKETKKYQQFKTDYQNSGVINFKLLNGFFDTKKSDLALILSSYIDIQSHLMDETLWFKLNIPGANVISPKYKVYTNTSLVNLHKNEIVWQKVYTYKIGADKFNMANPVSTPNYEQIKRLKTVSQRTSEDIVANTNLYLASQQLPAVEMVQTDTGELIGITKDEKGKKRNTNGYAKQWTKQLKNVNLIR